MKTRVSLQLLLTIACLMGVVVADDAMAKKDLPPSTPRELTQLLQGKVMPGWIAIYEEKDAEIKIIREQPSVMEEAGPNLGGEEALKIGNATLYLKLSPLISEAQYQRMKNENLHKQKKLDALYKVLSETPSVQGIQHEHGPLVMPSTFYSSVPTDQAKIDEYYRLEKSLHELPSGFFRNLSLSWLAQDTELSVGWVPRDEYVRRESEVVFKQVDAVLSKY